MSEQVSILTLVLSIVASFFASWLFFVCLQGRKKLIKSKIADLKFEEDFLDRIKKGNVELIRSGIKFVALAFFCIFSSGTALLVIEILELSPDAVKVFYICLFFCGLAAASLSFSYLRSLISLNDVEAAKSKLADKRKKLEEKLS